MALGVRTAPDLLLTRAEGFTWTLRSRSFTLYLSNFRPCGVEEGLRYDEEGRKEVRPEGWMAATFRRRDLVKWASGSPSEHPRDRS